MRLGNRRSLIIWPMLAQLLIAMDGRTTVTCGSNIGLLQADQPQDSTSELNPKVVTAEIPEWFKADFEFGPDQPFLFVESQYPAQSVDHAKRELRNEMIRAIQSIAPQWAGVEDASLLEFADRLNFDDLVFRGRRVFVKDMERALEAQQEFGEKLDFYRGYAQLHLTDEFRDELQQEYQFQKTKQRLVSSGFVAASVVASLAILFVYLKLETATRGFYSRRLQTASVLIAALVIAFVYWLSTQIS